MPSLLPRARRVSRLVVLGAVASRLLVRSRASGQRLDQAVVLAALTLGMPHGAADTELLRTAAHGSRPRHGALIAGYALLATAATVVVRRGGGSVERGVLLASALHFGEGELACWGDPPAGHARRRAALRLVSAAVTTVALPAAVGAANRRPLEVGLSGALPAGALAPDAAPPRGAGDRGALALLRDPATRRTVAPLVALAAVTTGALVLSRDREPAGDGALLTTLALLTPPSTSFAAYFGGWHALRHTARVVDALVADGEMPAQPSLPAAVVELGRRSAWAAGVGVVGAGVLAVADRGHVSDNAFAAVLGLTVPHMTTVALELSRRGR